MNEKEIENSEVINRETSEAYKVKRFLGRGKFSKCYELEEISTRRKFAGKVQDEGEDKVKSKMIQIEIDILKSLSHSHIVKLYGHFNINSQIIMLLELCSCGSLRTMLQKRKRFTIFEVRYFVKQISSALKYMHENRVIHRDIKLENIFLDKNMNVKVGDLNLSASTSTDENWNNRKVGTVLYMAPEILLGKGLTYKADIWSLGCVMYCLLIGHSPFSENDSFKSICKHIKMCKYEIPWHLDRSASVLLKKILRKDPTKRPDAANILQDSFLAREGTPQRLRVSCLHTEPSFTKKMTVRKRPFGDRSREQNPIPVADPVNSEMNIYSLRSGVKRKRSIQPISKRCKLN